MGLLEVTSEFFPISNIEFFEPSYALEINKYPGYTASRNPEVSLTQVKRYTGPGKAERAAGSREKDKEATESMALAIRSRWPR